TGSDAPAPTRAASQPLIELIVVGCLPVRASLWLVPYADTVARELGPTALVRLDEAQPTLQLLRAPPEIASRRWPTLADAIADLGRHIGTWLVRPAYDVTPDQMVRTQTDRVTILTSVNDSAIVKAYQEIKLLSEAAKQGVTFPTLGVAVLGADHETAGRFHEHLRHTTASFLSYELSLAACVPRVDAAVGSAGRVTFPAEPYPSLDELMSWVRAAQPPPVTVAEETRHEEPEPAPVEAAARRTVKLAPKPRIEVESKPPSGTREPDKQGAAVLLAGWVDDVLPLETRSPGHERLEIAVDPAGRLHVLAHEQDMRGLSVVAAWAVAHAELIARAFPDRWIDPTANPVLHVFTDRPASLADLHGSDLRLHVLAPVDVDGRRGWYHAPLNADVR
ncbi:MAG: hypothetical protein V3S08_02875, partial [Phycisphaerales bacterium]